MDKPRDLFMHELGDILYAERTLVKTLPMLAEEATDSQLVAALEKHLAETEGHVENVEAAFEAIGEQPKAEKCPGIEGIKKEHDEFVTNEEPSRDVLDMFLTGAAARTEHYEIAAYTGLITMAKALGETDAAKLLGENLKDEKAALEMVTTISEKLASKIPANA
jgi:ferritin-like metal-binding protein YciE